MKIHIDNQCFITQELLRGIQGVCKTQKSIQSKHKTIF